MGSRNGGSSRGFSKGGPNLSNRSSYSVSQCSLAVGTGVVTGGVAAGLPAGIAKGLAGSAAAASGYAAARYCRDRETDHGR